MEFNTKHRYLDIYHLSSLFVEIIPLVDKNIYNHRVMLTNIYSSFLLLQTDSTETPSFPAVDM